MSQFKKLICFTLAAPFFFQGAAHAQDKVPAGHIALVNSIPLPTALFEQVLKNNAAQGAKETPEIRNLVRSELIGRAALSQEAVKLGLDKQEKTLSQMELMKQNLL